MQSQVLFGTVYWAKVKKFKEDNNHLMRKIYGDASIYYLISLGKPNFAGCDDLLWVIELYTRQSFQYRASFSGLHQMVPFATSLLCTSSFFVNETGHLKSPRVPRILISIISCKVILNIRQYGNGRQDSDMNNAGTISAGEPSRPISSIRFDSGQNSGLDTILGLH